MLLEVAKEMGGNCDLAMLARRWQADRRFIAALRNNHATVLGRLQVAG